MLLIAVSQDAAIGYPFAALTDLEGHMVKVQATLAKYLPLFERFIAANTHSDVFAVGGSITYVSARAFEVQSHWGVLVGSDSASPVPRTPPSLQVPFVAVVALWLRVQLRGLASGGDYSVVHGDSEAIAPWRVCGCVSK